MATVAPVHAVIISWPGMHAPAAAIAAALQGHVARLDVIYSNHDAAPETGPGDWHGVPQAWFFGRKFRRSLELHGGGDLPMLQINADAAHDDWPALARRAAAVMAGPGGIGVWSPEIDWTPWPTAVVAAGPADAQGLTDVLQPDGVVWALAPAILAKLATMDYEVNNLGWGIDWAAVCHARAAGLRVVRDGTVHVAHPESRGYDAAEAARHLEAFVAQLPPADRDWVAAERDRLRRLRAEFRSGRQTGAAALAPAPAPALVPETAALAAQEPALVRVQLIDGSVYLATTEPIEGRDIGLQAGDAAIGFVPGPAPPAVGLPRPLPLAPAELPVATVRMNDLGAWQVADWPTLRVGFRAETPARLLLTAPVVLTPGEGPQRLRLRMAAHRSAGRLLVRLTGPDGQVDTTHSLEFTPDFPGGAEPAQWQDAALPLPVVAVSTTLQLELDYPGGGAPTPAEPVFFFVADPRLVPQDPSGSPSEPVGLELRSLPGAALHWHRAILPQAVMRGAAPLQLQVAGATLPLPWPAAVRVTMRRDWGHVIELESPAPLSGCLWVDGAPSCMVSLRAGHNALRLPVRHLTGGHALIELRDLSGTRIHWQDWCLTPRQLTTVAQLQRESRSPYPSDLMPQSHHRYRALRAHCAAGSPPGLIAQLDHAIEALEAGHRALRMRPLAFPRVPAPDVSVIIPAHNKVAVTYAGLCGLLLAWNRASFEVIVVDDASTDETARLEEIVSGITVVRHDTPQRFIRACNAGVAAARGDYVVLLNNDTEPTAGWLDEMIAAFHRFDRVGLTGARLLYPDGRQQEAGGIVWASGDPWNYGRLQNPWEPRFSYARQADYLSGAAMMTTRAIWDEVGGLSSYLEPMYFEDTDFAFKVREAGYTTWYVPSAVVYHYEGLTSGTDTATGFKRFQEVNRPKFKQRWADAFAGFSAQGTAPDLEKDRGIRGRVLFVDYTTPTPDRDAGSYAALQEMRMVQALGCKVTFLPENLSWLGSYTEDLQKMGVEVIVAPFFRSVDEFLDQRGAEFDAVYITRYHVANKVVPRIRQVNPRAKILMNNADLHFLRELRAAHAENDTARMAAADAVREQELAAMRAVDLVLSYNEVEHAVIQSHTRAEVRVMTCPWVVEFPPEVPPRPGRVGLSFLGGFRHFPNLHGVSWMVREVMPGLARALPSVVLSIYGSGMGPEVRALAGPHVRPVGFVDEVHEAFDPHLIFVAPLLSGAGVKGKVMAAMSHGIPCVLTPFAAEGIGLRHGQECLICRTPAEWIDAIVALHGDPALWQSLADNARRFVGENFSFPRGVEQMRAAFAAVDLFGA